MNEACQAKEGVEPSIFPENVPVFTGHYHKPHVVDNSQIEYVGSPYQVSASESGQTKRFLLLNSSWEVRYHNSKLALKYGKYNCKGNMIYRNGRLSFYVVYVKKLSSDYNRLDV